MNLITLLTKIKNIAANHSLVNQAEIGDVYSILNREGSIKYGCVTCDITSVERAESSLIYTCYLYYADRTLQDNSNEKIIQSDAFTILSSIINKIQDELNVDIEDGWIIQAFSQKFFDYCAGGWAEFRLVDESDLGDCGID